jgi:hypothetical protein
MLTESVETVVRDRIIFRDGSDTQHEISDATFRSITDYDDVFAHGVEPQGEWEIEVDGEIIATGGLMYHYNPPYSDLYMEVAPPGGAVGMAPYLFKN